MIITTTNSIPKIQWQDTEILGIVSGSAIQPKYTYKKSTDVGIRNYISRVNEARELAAERMSDEADKLGASAVVNAEYVITPLSGGEIEVMIYGTAFKYNSSASDGKLIVEIEPISFTPQGYNGENILNMNYSQENILKKSLEKTDVKSVLRNIYEKTSDLSYEVVRVLANKENIDYIFDEIAEMTVLFGQLALMETAAITDLKTVIDEKIKKINNEVKKENTILTYAERKKYYDTL